MIMVRSKPDQTPLSAVVTTLDRVFRPDPVIPDTMLALLKAMDVTPAFIAAAVPSAREALRPA